MATVENTPLKQDQAQPELTENTEQFAVVTEDGIYELTTTSPSVSYENATWQIAPEGFTGLLPGDKFK